MRKGTLFGKVVVLTFPHTHAAVQKEVEIPDETTDDGVLVVIVKEGELYAWRRSFPRDPVIDINLGEIDVPDEFVETAKAFLKANEDLGKFWSDLSELADRIVQDSAEKFPGVQLATAA